MYASCLVVLPEGRDFIFHNVEFLQRLQNGGETKMQTQLLNQMGSVTLRLPFELWPKGKVAPPNPPIPDHVLFECVSFLQLAQRLLQRTSAARSSKKPMIIRLDFANFPFLLFATGWKFELMSIGLMLTLTRYNIGPQESKVEIINIPARYQACSITSKRLAN